MKKLKYKNYYKTLSLTEIEKFIKDLYFTLEDEMQILNNINRYSFETLYDLARVMIDIAKSHGYKLFSNDDDFYLEEIVYEIEGPLSAEVEPIYKSTHTKERAFMINVLGHMSNILYYPAVDYQDMYYEIEEDWNREMLASKEITSEEFDENEIILNEAKEELDVYSRSLIEISIPTLQSSFDIIKNNKPYQELLRLIKLIDNKPISLFINPFSEEVEFTNSMRIEYDFNNFLTEKYTMNLDESINNEGIGNACILTKLGIVNNIEKDIAPYVLLIEEVNKIIDNEFA